MRVLILSCNTGEGHNSAAKAIKESFDAHGVYCEIIDSLAFVSRASSKVISKGHVRIYRHMPSLFNRGYRFTENHPRILSQRATLNRFFNIGRSKLHRYITDGGFDTIICTHPFTGMMLTSVKRKYGLNVRSCIVATDYTCSPGSTQNTVDYYFVPDEALIDDFSSKGAPGEKIVVSGIPVRRMFTERISKAEAKMKLGIPEDMPHLVMMCGSMGCGPIEEISELLCKNIDKGHFLTVITGTNKRLFNALTEQFAGMNNVHICGFITDMSLYMDAADIYMTKAGGISTSEALCKAVPMAFIKAVAGCEDYNAAFFVNMGAAIESDSVEGLVGETLSLLGDSERIGKMVDAMREKSGRNPSEIIYETLSR